MNELEEFLIRRDHITWSEARNKIYKLKDLIYELNLAGASFDDIEEEILNKYNIPFEFIEYLL